MTSVLSYGVRLTLVLGHAGVDMPVLLLAHIPIFPSLVGGVGVGDFVLDNVGTDGRLEDIGQGVGVLAGSPIGANDRDSRARHLYCLLVVRCENLQSSSSGLRKFNRRLICSSAANLWEGPVHEEGAARAGLGKRNRCEAPSKGSVL